MEPDRTDDVLRNCMMTWRGGNTVLGVPSRLPRPSPN